jgi:uncharacterized repeat protein (TIGR03803 family)
MMRFQLQGAVAACAVSLLAAGCAQSSGVLPKGLPQSTSVRHASGSGSYTLPWSFAADGSQGSAPSTTPYVDGAGALYGQNGGGGANRLGTVYKLTPNGSGGYTETTLHSFAGGSGDGQDPDGEITGDSSGAIYGTTYGGVDAGTVFKFTPTGSGYTYSVIYSFKDNPDGAGPQGGVIVGKKGELFGTTSVGGAGACYHGCGVAFKMARHGKTYKESVIYTFGGPLGGDGATPLASLVMDNKGALYGTTEYGGSLGQGTVFQLKPHKGKYKETVLHSFAGPSGGDGQNPEGRLILDAHGYLYGTANTGGVGSCDCGMVFKVGTNGKHYSIIASFQGGGSGNHTRAAALALGANGILYGTAYQGGEFDSGLLYALAPVRSGYSETILHNFGGAYDGAGPYAGVVADGKGHYFGTTVGGGVGDGAVFEFTP